MSASPKERCASESARITPRDLKESAKYNRRLQASLAARMNCVCEIAELMPPVLAVTLAQGTASRADRVREAL